MLGVKEVAGDDREQRLNPQHYEPRHLLVKDTGGDVISPEHAVNRRPDGARIQSAQEPPWAFWEDRYHATAIQADDHLHQCVVYIDLDMVRAGVVKHPREWENSGYREIQKPPSRCGIIDVLKLNALFVGGERMTPVAYDKELTALIVIDPYTISFRGEAN